MMSPTKAKFLMYVLIEPQQDMVSALKCMRLVDQMHDLQMMMFKEGQVGIG